MLFEILAELLVHQLLDEALHLAVAQLGLGLPFELRLLHLDADHRRESFAHIFALQRLAFLLQETVGARVGVDRAGQGRLEADQVCTAFDGVDVVGEGVDVLRVAVVPLQRNLDLEVLAFTLEVDHLRMDRRLGAIEMLDELLDTALVVELMLLLRPLVVDEDAHTAVEEREFAQPLGEDVEAEVELLEDERVGLEGDLGAALARRTDFLQLSIGFAALIALLVDLALALDFNLQVF
jgi:hypothetical protein